MRIMARLDALERACVVTPDDGRCRCNPRYVAVTDETMDASPRGDDEAAAGVAPPKPPGTVAAACPKCGGVADVLMIRN